jgi:hypothetical protein
MIDHGVLLNARFDDAMLKFRDTFRYYAIWHGWFESRRFFNAAL